jgi:Putative phage tail protein
MAETIGFLILSSLEAGAVIEGAAAIGATTILPGLTVATAVGTAAILGASIAVAFATQPEVPKASDGSQPIRQPIPPRPFGYGRTRIAGAYMLFEVDDVTGESWDVLALHQGKIAGIVHVYLADDLVQLNPANGFVNGLLNLADSDTRYNHNSANRVQLKFTQGLATETAFADVVAVLPTLWTSAHRGDGVASLMLHCVDVASADVLKVYPRQLPKPSVVADLSPIWDPRDGGQSQGNPATWTVKSNPVLQLLDYLTHADRGPALDYATLIAPRLAEWKAEADICDELVAKADLSTEPRYKSDGWAFLTTDPAEVIGAILNTCDGWLAENGDGTLSLKVGKYRAPAVTFTDDHIVGFTIDKGVADEEAVNEVQFTYAAAQANWRDAPGVSFRDEASISELGVVRSTRLSLNWVQSHGQGRRLAKRALARHTATARGQLVTSLYGLKALGERWVRVRSRLIADLADAVIEITRVRIDLANARLTFEWTLVNPNSIDAWNPATEEGVPPNYFPVPAAVTAQDHGAGNEIRVEWDELDPAQPWLYYVVDYRLGTAGPWTRQVFFGSSVVDVGAKLRVVTNPVSAGTYSVRIAATGHQMMAPGTPYLYPFALPVVAATTGNITLSGTQTIDGVSVIANDPVLVKNQSAPAQNGVYLAAAGAWTRTTTMDTWTEVVGAQVRVSAGGTVNAGKLFVSANNPLAGVIGTTPIVFDLFQPADPDLVWAPSVGGITGVVIA